MDDQNEQPKERPAEPEAKRVLSRVALGAFACGLMFKASGVEVPADPREFDSSAP